MNKTALALGAAGAAALVGALLLPSSATSLLVGMSGLWLLAIGALVVHPLAGAAAAAGLAALVSAYLTWQHQEALAGGHSFCSVNETFNCDVVNTSQYSEVFGIPIALFGTAFYAAIAFVAYSGWKAREGYARAATVVQVAGLLSVLTSTFLVWASTQVGAWCIMCISTYGLGALVLVGGFLGPRALLPELGPALTEKSGNNFLVIFLVTVAIGWVAIPAPGATTASKDAQPSDMSAFYSKPKGTVTIRGSEPSVGRPDAPITVVEWADYECPYCGLVAPKLKELVAKNPDVRVIFKNYPLSNACNPSVNHAMHANACAAAVAGVCAQKQGKFWEMNKLMFANQKYLAKDDILFLAKEHGIDSAALSTCMDDPAAMQVVQQDIAEGALAGVDSTPSLFVSGIHPSGFILMEQGADGLEVLLQAKATGMTLPEPGPPPAR